MDWETVGLVFIGIAITLYIIFFNSVIAGFESLLEFITDEFERIPRAFCDAIYSSWLRIIQILIFTALLTAF